jgi:hypothetical protein
MGDWLNDEPYDDDDIDFELNKYKSDEQIKKERKEYEEFKKKIKNHHIIFSK